MLYQANRLRDQQKRTYKTNPHAVENMAHNEKKDEYTRALTAES